jgi:hypothetical protein
MGIKALLMTDVRRLGGAADNEHEEHGRVGQGRRSDDHPDWKAVAPRWLLVMIAGGFAVMVTANVRQHMHSTEDTGRKVLALRTDVGVIQGEQARVRLEMKSVRWEVLSARVDALRYQSYMARKNRDLAFANDLEDRLRNLEKQQEYFARELRIEER